MRPCLALISSIALSSPLARAQTAVDTFAPGGTFSTNWLYNYGGGPSAPDRLGFGFDSQATGPLTDISAAIFRSGAPGSLVFELYADSAALPGTPGSLLFSTLFPAPAAGNPLVATTLTLVAGPQLTAGVTYYAVFTPQSPSTQVRWYLGGDDPNTAPHGPEVFRFAGGPWLTDSQAYAAFRLTVPSPGAAALLAAAAALPHRRRRLIRYRDRLGAR